MRKTRNYLNKIIAKSLFIILLLESCSGHNSAIDSVDPLTTISHHHIQRKNILKGDSTKQKSLLTKNHLWTREKDLQLASPKASATHSTPFQSITQKQLYPITPVQASHLLQEQTHGKQSEGLSLNKQKPINKHTKQITASLYQAKLITHQYATSRFLNTPLNWKSKEGHQLHQLYLLDNLLYATIYNKGSSKISQELPARFTSEVTLAQLATYTPMERAQLLRIILDTQDTKGYTLIGQLGIKGGGKKKKKNKIKENRAHKQKVSEQNKVTSCQEREKEKANENKQPIIKKVNKTDEQNLDFPDPKKLYVVQPQSLSSDEEATKELFKEALTLTLQHDNSDNNHLKEALTLFTKAANQGCIPAMYQIGLICEKQQNMDLAIRWFVLAFQNIWFIKPNQAYLSPAYNKLKELIKQGNSQLNNLFLFYPNIDSSLKKWGRLEALCGFYRNAVVEPYLNTKENDLKIKRLRQEQTSIILNMSEEQHNEKNRISEDFKKARHYSLRKDYVNAKKHYLKCQELPEALYYLGVFYQNGYGIKDSKSNYKKAAKFFEKAQTVSAFLNLGTYYMEGFIGKIDNNPDYQKAIHYLELSGHPDALCNLGILFKVRYVDKFSNQPNYQKAKTYFERSGTPNAYAFLGDLYYVGAIGKNTPYPDYEQAHYYYEIAANQDVPEALVALGELYTLGHVGNPNYQLGLNYYMQALTNPTLPDRVKKIAHHNIATVYTNGQVGLKENKPDYQKATYHFQQAALPESFYHIGNFYTKGYLQSPKKNTKSAYNYKKAIKYYKLSGLPEGKLEILCLYQENFLMSSEGKKMQVIKEINDLLPTLPTSKRFYIQGIKEYYCGELENALISLQNAILWGINEEDLRKIIQEIEDYLERREEKDETIKEEFEDEIESTSTQSSILAPTLEESIQNQENEDNAITELKSKTSSIFAKTKERSLKPKTKQPKKQQKKLRRAARIKLNFLKTIPNQSESMQEIEPPITFEFLDEAHKEQFLIFKEKEENKKLVEILNDIQSNNYKAAGVGKPEVLRYTFKGHKGCLSRRLNDEDRLVYKPIEKGKILILSWKGHYI
ncbi:MAG: hypothetical protein BGO68_05730 [Candidatus Amoebophilus sp. 36-38]|nr:MAG: hypothetical protein BGO68_05730 [Candidatus Amoebophilus sp. 36-38]